MTWALESTKDIKIDVSYEHYYWGIHDVQHALYDEAGCTVYVTGDIEAQRLHDAFKIMNDMGKYPTYNMVDNIQTAFRERFRYEINLEEYLEVDEWS